MNDFDDEASISPDLAAAIDAGVYHAFIEGAPQLIHLIGQLRAAGATFADIELRIATWPQIDNMRLWLEAILRHLDRQEQATGASDAEQTIQGIWFADDQVSVPDLGDECKY